MAFHPNQQLRLLEKGFNPAQMLRQSLIKDRPWESIVDFATHESFCNQTLYPRQATLLKLIYLETEQMTAYDIDVIEDWRVGFTRHRDVYGVQPDIWERIEYLKHRGYRRFPHVQAVLGRRASKGFIGAILAAEQIAYLITLDNPQAHFSIRDSKDCFLNVGATSQTQAQRHQFADIRDVVEGCAWLQPYIAETKDHQMRLRTPADLRRIATMKSQGVDIEHTIASLWVVALSASSVSGRGATSYANFFDEFAFHVQGTDSTKSSENIYEDWQPSLGQFKKDALTYVPSSPFCLQPSTPVLTEDLRWVPVGSLNVGDKLIGFDEDLPGGKGKGRTWQPAEVTETSIIWAPRYKITMESGKELVSTSEHMWLARRSQYDYEWFKTSKLKPGDKIKSLGVDPWGSDDTREGGYLAGFFDGEGYVAGRLNKFYTLGYSQNNGVVNDYVKELLLKKGFSYTDHTEGEKLAKVRINGGQAEIMRFLGQIRPERLLPKFHAAFYGSRIYGSANPAVDIVASVEYLDEGEVVALGTSTNTLVADGLLSHNTKTGKFFELYQHGKVLMSNYQDESGMGEEAKAALAAIRNRADADEVEMGAEPGMLIFQGASWDLYRDWERGPELVRVLFDAAPEDDLRSEEQLRRKIRNPEKFKVEREGQFAEVLGQYLDPDKVDAMFDNVPWREVGLCIACDEYGQTPEGAACQHPAKRTPFGRFDMTYRIHADPSKNGANFALAVAHTELAPEDAYGERWPHVILDRLHVWKASDFPVNPETGKREIDYLQVERELDELLYTFPSTTKFSTDQFNSVGLLQRLRKKYGPNIRVVEDTATEKGNWERAEKFKSALTLGWVHAFSDELGERGGSLLEQECKFLSERNGKVIKQDSGPVTTKDLYDAVSTVVTDLLHEDLERWGSGDPTGRSYGHTNPTAIRNTAGVPMDSSNLYAAGTRGTGKGWEKLDAYQEGRARRSRNDPAAARYQPSNLRRIRPR